MAQIYVFPTGKSTSIQADPDLRNNRVSSEGKRIHTCSICGHCGTWNRHWRWYGSYKDIDESKPVEEYCSKACAMKSGYYTEENWKHPDDE